MAFYRYTFTNVARAHTTNVWLQGKEVKLKKTLAVMKKQEGELTEEGTNTSYDVIALIKKKIIFMTRPHSLIGGAHKGLSTVIKA